MNIERINYLLDRYMNDEATASEKDELQQLINENKNESLIIEAIREGIVKYNEPYNISNVTAFLDIPATVVEIDKGDNLVNKASVRSLNSYYRWIWIAASILLIVVTGTYVWLVPKRSNTAVVVKIKNMDIQPGHSGAVLMLANGSQVLLDTAHEGLVASQNGIKTKIVEGRLIYEGMTVAGQYNTMYTPKGRQYQLILSDGTKVWLNAASSIRYPLTFTENERRVDITGEVYFEVAKNTKKPFIVNVNNKAKVEVTGTRFNVNAYDNEPNIATTLLEGRVNITIGKEATVLRPGQQALVKNDEVSLKIANEDDVIAWKNGLFNFENMSLEEVMRQLERWYDIEVVYKGVIPNVELEGKMTRDVTLNGLIKVLKKLNVNASLEGNKLIVAS